MVDMPVRMNDQTVGTHDPGILDVSIKLDAKVQRKDQSPAVAWADFDVFSIGKSQAVIIA